MLVGSEMNAENGSSVLTVRSEPLYCQQHHEHFVFCYRLLVHEIQLLQCLVMHYLRVRFHNQILWLDLVIPVSTSAHVLSKSLFSNALLPISATCFVYVGAGAFKID